MNLWRSDVEGMDREVVKVMIAFGYAKKHEAPEVIVGRFNNPEFEKTNAYIAVSTAAEDNYTDKRVPRAGR